MPLKDSRKKLRASTALPGWSNGLLRKVAVASIAAAVMGGIVIEWFGGAASSKFAS